MVVVEVVVVPLPRQLSVSSSSTYIGGDALAQHAHVPFPLHGSNTSTHFNTPPISAPRYSQVPVEQPVPYAGQVVVVEVVVLVVDVVVVSQRESLPQFTDAIAPSTHGNDE